MDRNVYKKMSEETTKSDFHLSPVLNTNGMVFISEKGAVFTLEWNPIEGCLFLKQHNAGKRKEFEGY